MENDYRKTKYCPDLVDVTQLKENVRQSVLSVHPSARDMHAYISKNDNCFKEKFARAYNCKCSYCGISTKVIPLEMFEIDHFIPQSYFGKSKVESGKIGNLVFSCSNCNRAKADYMCSESARLMFHPDGENIKKLFTRDNQYYIRIANNFQNDNIVQEFYYKVKLNDPWHRVDYLLMNMMGLSKKITDTHPAYGKLMKAIDLLRTKRNSQLIIN